MSTVIVSAQVPADIAAALRNGAATADRSLSAEIRRALRVYVETSNAPATNQGVAKADAGGHHGAG